MNSNQHSIRKFTLDLQLPPGHDAYALQRRCSDIIKQELVKGLDGLLKTYFDESQIIRIHRIELDLGNMTADDLENKFADKCLQELTEKFKTIGLQKKPGEILVKQLDKKQNVIDQFIYFLSSGQLPSVPGMPSIDEWKNDILNAIKEKPEYFKDQFLPALSRQTQLTRRLFFQFDKTFAEEFFYACESSVKKQLVGSILRDAIIIEKRIIQFNDKFIEEFFYTYDPALQDEISELLSLVQRMDLKNSSFKHRGKILKALLEMVNKTSAGKTITVAREIIKLLRQPEGKPELFLKQLLEGAKEIQKKEIPDIKQELNDKTEKQNTTETAVFIENAGLIIFHPFLTGLFEKTGLMHNNSFIDDDARNRAVHLLQYMADGQEQLPEYLMPLNKILCGMPAEVHVDRFIVLTKEEKEEANQLMQAVIGHWTILKNTSVHALQETFLQRKGKLSFMEEDRFWKLQVEKSGLDVLLDKLPWGYSYIQLPWMKHRLITEWR